MIKNKKIAYLIIIGLFLIAPVNTFARNSAKPANKSNCTGACKTCAKNVCSSDFKISMSVSGYDHNSYYSGCVNYSNSTNSREVTVSVPQTALNQGAVYRIRVFYSKYGTIDNSFFNLGTDLDDLDNDDLDDGLKVFKTNIKKDMSAVNKENSAIKVARAANSNSVSISIKSGYEAVVVAYLNKDVETNSKCENNNKKKFNVTCKNGTDIESDAGTISLAGVSASQYVQNPSATILVKNLRGRGKEYGSTCNNAYDGKYDSKTATGTKNDTADKKYTITDPNALTYYRQHYYPQMLGTYYCEKLYVAFNLTEAQIAKLSNRALRMFYKSWKLSEKTSSSSGYSDTYTEVDNYVNQLLNKTDENGNKLVTKVNEPKVSGLTCDENSNSVESKEYLYVKDDKIKTVPLSDGSTPTVCETKCYEHLKVSYDPPVASKAGICFTYKVTVESETKCGVKYNKEVIEGNGMEGGLVGKLQKDMCAPVPICSAKETHTQAGPSEEFDNCINECDGGKYSQNCINKCYNDVYKNNNKSKKEKNDDNTKQTSKKKDEKVSASLLTYNTKTSKSNMLRLGTWSETKLEGYYKQSTAISKCDTKDEVLKNIDECAEYFFEAKTLYPKGKYNKNGTAWHTELANQNNIWNAIGRASPFYIRDKSSTKELIQSILATDPHSGKTYNIDENGIKRQYRGGIFVCSESCSYTGCSTKNALTPSSFISSLNVSDNSESSIDKDDMAKIDDALDKCIATSECEGANNTSEFEIKVENPRQKKDTKTTTINGKTTIGSSTGSTTSDSDIECGSGSSGDNPFSMFVPARDDDVSKTTTGITGLCYDENVKSPHYKTTITFPGSWINLKTGEVSYKDKCANYFDYQDEMFCSMYDSANVNTNWWKWRINSNRTGSAPKPDSYNITATMGKNNAKFGKYHWTIDYKCFYAISDFIGGGGDDTGGGDTGGGDTGGGDDTCKDCGTTSIDNVDMRFVQTGKELFPNNRKPGFNWTSDATDIALRKEKCNSETTTCAATKGYDIDPGAYAEEIKTKGDKVYDETPEVHIQINGRKDFDTIGQYTSNISKFDGSLGNGYTKSTDIEFLYYYTSDILKKLNGNIKMLDISYERGKNYK